MTFFVLFLLNVLCKWGSLEHKKQMLKVAYAVRDGIRTSGIFVITEQESQLGSLVSKNKNEKQEQKQKGEHAGGQKRRRNEVWL